MKFKVVSRYPYQNVAHFTFETNTPRRHLEKDIQYPFLGAVSIHHTLHHHHHHHHHHQYQFNSIITNWWLLKCESYPIGSMYGIYANIGGILMGSVLPYLAYMDPIGIQSSSILVKGVSWETCLILEGSASQLCLLVYNPLTIEYYTIPIGSMYGIFNNIYPKYHPNVGKYTIHGS